MTTGSRSPREGEGGAVAGDARGRRRPGSERRRSSSAGVGQLDGEAAPGLAEQLGDPLDRDQPAAADDPDPVADPLHLVELVRGEEDGAAAVAFLGDEGEELLLHQRVEAAGRLVEDQQLGPVEGGEDQADLLAVAARELAERPVEVGAKARRQLLGAGGLGDAAQAAARSSTARRPVLSRP